VRGSTGAAEATSTIAAVTSSNDVDIAVLVVGGLVGSAVYLFYVAAMWRVFTKAGREGWHALVPILNTYTLIRIAGRPGWWTWLTFVPCVGLVVMAVVLFDLADVFGHGPWFGVGLLFLAPIFLPILGFGSSTYLSNDPYDRRLAEEGPLRRPPTTGWNRGGAVSGGGPPALPSLHGAGEPAAGWYPDPEGAAGQRWWDGTRWSEHRAP
jgi:hypothetical protein